MFVHFHLKFLTDVFFFNAAGCQFKRESGRHLSQVESDADLAPLLTEPDRVSHVTYNYSFTLFSSSSQVLDTLNRGCCMPEVLTLLRISFFTIRVVIFQFDFPLIRLTMNDIYTAGCNKDFMAMFNIDWNRSILCLYSIIY